MRKLLAILVLPLLLVLIAAALAPKLAPEQRLRAEAIALLRAATGFEADISGDVRFSALPWPSLEVQGLDIGDPAHGGLTVPKARIVLDLLPLLTGTARADYVALTNPTMTVGQASSVSHVIAPVLQIVATRRISAQMKVEDGLLRLVDGDGGVLLLARVDGDLTWRGGSSLVFDGRLVWHDEPVDVDIAFTQLAALVEGKPVKLRASASGPTGELSYDGSFGFAGGLSAEGTFASSSRSLRKTLEWLGYEAPTEKGFGPFALNAGVLYSGQAATLSQVRLELDGNVGEGGFNLRFDRDRGQIQGSLAANSLDLTPYGQISLASADGRSWSEDPIDLQKFQLFDLDLRLSAAEVRASGARLQRLAASAAMKGGRLSFAIGEAEGWKGTFRASAQIAPAAAGPGAEVRLELACDTVDLAQALGDIFHLTRLEGTGSFQVTAMGTGRSVADILGHLDGTVELDGNNGGLIGIDATRILTRLAQRPLSGMGSLRGGRTPFDQIATQVAIKSGIATLSSFAIDSSRLAVRMSGTTVVSTGDLDLAGTAELKDASGSAKPFDLPFVIKGTWDEPLLLPDPQSLIRRSGAARPLFGTQMEATGIGIVTPAP